MSGDPLTYTHGVNQVIRGVEAAVEGMEVGQAKQAIVPTTIPLPTKTLHFDLKVVNIS